MRMTAAVLVTVLCFAGVAHGQPYQPTWDSLDKRPTPAWFQDAKFGIFIHWGVYSVRRTPPCSRQAGVRGVVLERAHGRQGPEAEPDPGRHLGVHRRQYGAEFDYKDFAPQFRAELFDADHWADVFLRSGPGTWSRPRSNTKGLRSGRAGKPRRRGAARGTRPRLARSATCWGELTNAVRAKGLKMGFYYSLYEWYNPLWLSDKPRFVAEHLFPQFKDVVTRYQPSIIFSDGEWDLPSAEWRSPELLAWLFNESAVKDEVVRQRSLGKDCRHKHGGYWTTEYTPGMADTAHPWEESRGMGFSYGYNRAERLEHYRTAASSSPSSSTS